MVALTQAPSLSSDLQVFYTTEPSLSNAIFVIAFGPSATPSAAINGSTRSAPASRIQSHVFTSLGCQSYPRLAISPSSPLYSAVTLLSREDQGDEVTRALAYILHKYFTELSDSTKSVWIQHRAEDDGSNSTGWLFSDKHAAQMAGRMTQVKTSEPVLQDLSCAFASASVSHVDADLVLPAGSIKELPTNRESLDYAYSSHDGLEARYGKYARLIELFGETAFIPTSRIRRAPSKPTAINRSPFFSKDQKEAFRREICELVDTEERYVGKIYDLVHSVAVDFRNKAFNAANGSSSNARDSVASLFPPSLDQILSVNLAFLEAIRVVLDDTEAAAIQDIETTVPDRPQDATGAERFADCLLEHLPSFVDCYAGYMKAHVDFGSHLRLFMGETGSSFAKLIHETGEQHLMSMLIEPIQRLPRYNLYIDNIVKQLPIRHQALKKFLKAKDIVSEICSQDEPTTQFALVETRLRAMVRGWPPTSPLTSRLITAVDLVELKAPYNPQRPDCLKSPMIFLLLADSAILLRKLEEDSVSARGLLAEIDTPRNSKAQASPPVTQDLEFVEIVKLSTTTFDTLADETLFRYTCAPEHSSNTFRRNRQLNVKRRVFNLKGSYEGKGSRLSKDIVKAQVESRFTESERESHKWEARDLDKEGMDLGIFAAIYEVPSPGTSSSRKPPTITIRFGSDADATGSPLLKTQESDIQILIKPKGDGFYTLEIPTGTDHRIRDVVTTSEFLPVLMKRLSTSIQMSAQMRNAVIGISLLRHHEEILQSLRLSNASNKIRGRQEFKGGSLRQGSRSPVKALANLFSRDNDTKDVGVSSPFAAIPELRAPGRPKSQLNLRSDKPLPEYPSKPTVVEPVAAEPGRSSSEALEATLSSYILALHARKGNVLAKSLLNRASADEAIINELYNSLLENPKNHELAAQAPVDVLFSAFDMFLKVAWKENIGPVIGPDVLSEMQMQSETLSPLDYEDVLVTKIAELSPQNQRALRAIVGLLVDLLDGMTSDGDRGALMATITQVVVCEGDPHEYMPLFDRFVEDHDIILNDTTTSRHGTPGSLGGSLASRSAAGGSISSKASSLTRRFGLGSLRRENSKLDPASKLGSVFRTWSKNGRTESSRPGMDRTQSADVESISSSRPSSRDQGTSGTNVGLLTKSIESLKIKEEDVGHGGTIRPRRKRRSSLSDLELLPTPNMSPLWSSPAFQGTGNAPRVAPNQSNATPWTPSPLKRGESNAGTETRTVVQQTDASLKKPIFTAEDLLNRASSHIDYPKTDEVTPLRPSKHGRSRSVIPIPKGVLSERVSSGNTPPPPPVPSKEVYVSPRKVRVHDSQKLRDRLETQQKGVLSAKSSLQDELDKISKEMQAVDLGRKGSVLRNGASSPTKSLVRGNQAEQETDTQSLTQLTTRVKALETKHAHLLRNLEMHVNSLDKDMKAALTAAERKNAGLEEKLRDANMENDILFERNNEELGRVFKRVKEGDGVEELKARLREAQQDNARLRRENASLKGEMVGLKAVILD